MRGSGVRILFAAPFIRSTTRQAKPALRALKLFDGRGLFLLLQHTGSRSWRFKYRINGKEKLLALQVYPEPEVQSISVARRQ